MFIRFRTKPLAHEIANMAKTDKDEITYICRKENIIRRVLIDMGRNLGTGSVLGRQPISLICTMSKLGMNSREHLFRGRWSRGEGKTIRVVVCVKLVQDGVLRGGGDGRGEGECRSGGR